MSGCAAQPWRLLVLALMAAGTVACSPALPALEHIDDEVIIVAPEDPGSSSGSAVGADAGAPSSASAYAAVWRHPEQRFVDSDIGPLPLWTETVYDAQGNPQPRFPDIFTKTLLDDPSPTTALAYLESQRVRARRYLQASQIMQSVAVAQGYVTPDAFRPPQERLSNARALVPPYQLRSADWGVPMLSPEQARLAGLTAREVPATPGRSTTRPVEVLLFSDHRCAFSAAAMRSFAAFGEEVFQRELGPRILTISLDNDSASTRAQLDYLAYTGVVTDHLENFLDQTDLAEHLAIRYTPTYLFLDRRSGAVTRSEGLKDQDALRHALLALVGHGDASWDQVDAAWFRATQAAPGAGRAPSPDPATTDPPPQDASPVLPPTRRVRAWNPDGQN